MNEDIWVDNTRIALNLAGVYNPSASGKGNPWHDPRTGRFTDAPPGVHFLTKGARDVMHAIDGAGKQAIDAQWRRFGGDRIMAVSDQEGQNAFITLWNSGTNAKTWQGWIPIKERKQPKTEKREKVKQQPKREPTPEETARRQTAINRAAKVLGAQGWDPNTVSNFLQRNGLSRRELTPDELNEFIKDAHAAWINNIAQAFDARNAKAAAPSRISDDWLRENIPNMSENDIAELVTALRDKGWSTQEIAKKVVPYIRKDMYTSGQGGTSAIENPEAHPELFPDMANWIRNAPENLLREMMEDQISNLVDAEHAVKYLPPGGDRKVAETVLSRMRQGLNAVMLELAIRDNRIRSARGEVSPLSIAQIIDSLKERGAFEKSAEELLQDLIEGDTEEEVTPEQRGIAEKVLGDNKGLVRDALTGKLAVSDHFPMPKRMSPQFWQEQQFVFGQFTREDAKEFVDYLLSRGWDYDEMSRPQEFKNGTRREPIGVYFAHIPEYAWLVPGGKQPESGQNTPDNTNEGGSTSAPDVARMPQDTGLPSGRFKTDEELNDILDLPLEQMDKELANLGEADFLAAAQITQERFNRGNLPVDKQDLIARMFVERKNELSQHRGDNESPDTAGLRARAKSLTNTDWAAWMDTESGTPALERGKALDEELILTAMEQMDAIDDAERSLENFERAQAEFGYLSADDKREIADIRKALREMKNGLTATTIFLALRRMEQGKDATPESIYASILAMHKRGEVDRKKIVDSLVESIGEQKKDLITPDTTPEEKIGIKDRIRQNNSPAYWEGVIKAREEELARIRAEGYASEKEKRDAELTPEEREKRKKAELRAENARRKAANEPILSQEEIADIIAEDRAMADDAALARGDEREPQGESIPTPADSESIGAEPGEPLTSDQQAELDALIAEQLAEMKDDDGAVGSLDEIRDREIEESLEDDFSDPFDDGKAAYSRSSLRSRTGFAISKSHNPEIRDLQERHKELFRKNFSKLSNRQKQEVIDRALASGISPAEIEDMLGVGRLPLHVGDVDKVRLLADAFDRDGGKMAGRDWMPRQIRQRWIEQNVPTLSPQEEEELISELKNRGWTDKELEDRVMPYLPSSYGGTPSKDINEGDRVKTKDGNRVGTVINISDSGDVTVQWDGTGEDVGLQKTFKNGDALLHVGDPSDNPLSDMAVARKEYDSAFNRIKALMGYSPTEPQAINFAHAVLLTSGITDERNLGRQFINAYNDLRRVERGKQLERQEGHMDVATTGISLLHELSELDTSGSTRQLEGLLERISPQLTGGARLKIRIASDEQMLNLPGSPDAMLHHEGDYGRMTIREGVARDFMNAIAKIKRGDGTPLSQREHNALATIMFHEPAHMNMHPADVAENIEDYQSGGSDLDEALTESIARMRSLATLTALGHFREEDMTPDAVRDAMIGEGDKVSSVYEDLPNAMIDHMMPFIREMMERGASPQDALQTAANELASVYKESTHGKRMKALDDMSNRLKLPRDTEASEGDGFGLRDIYSTNQLRADMARIISGSGGKYGSKYAEAPGEKLLDWPTGKTENDLHDPANEGASGSGKYAMTPRKTAEVIRSMPESMFEALDSRSEEDLSASMNQLMNAMSGTFSNREGVRLEVDDKIEDSTIAQFDSEDNVISVSTMVANDALSGIKKVREGKMPNEKELVAMSAVLFHETGHGNINPSAYDKAHKEYKEGVYDVEPPDITDWSTYDPEDTSRDPRVDYTKVVALDEFLNEAASRFEMLAMLDEMGVLPKELDTLDIKKRFESVGGAYDHLMRDAWNTFSMEIVDRINSGERPSKVFADISSKLRDIYDNNAYDERLRLYNEMTKKRPPLPADPFVMPNGRREPKTPREKKLIEDITDAIRALEGQDHPYSQELLNDIEEAVFEAKSDGLEVPTRLYQWARRIVKEKAYHSKIEKKKQEERNKKKEEMAKPGPLGGLFDSDNYLKKKSYYEVEREIDSENGKFATSLRGVLGDELPNALNDDGTALADDNPMVLDANDGIGKIEGVFAKAKKLLDKLAEKMPSLAGAERDPDQDFTELTPEEIDDLPEAAVSIIEFINGSIIPDEMPPEWKTRFEALERVGALPEAEAMVREKLQPKIDEAQMTVSAKETTLLGLLLNGKFTDMASMIEDAFDDTELKRKSLEDLTPEKHPLWDATDPEDRALFARNLMRSIQRRNIINNIRFGANEDGVTYGHLRYEDNPYPGLAARVRYGKIAIVLKDDVRDRTTLTFGDTWEGVLPSPIKSINPGLYMTSPVGDMNNGGMNDLSDFSMEDFILAMMTHDHELKKGRIDEDEHAALVDAAENLTPIFESPTGIAAMYEGLSRALGIDDRYGFFYPGTREELREKIRQNDEAQSILDELIDEVKFQSSRPSNKKDRRFSNLLFDMLRFRNRNGHEPRQFEKEELLANLEKALDEFATPRQNRESVYEEIQVHGAVTPDHVEAVEIPSYDVEGYLSTRTAKGHDPGLELPYYLKPKLENNGYNDDFASALSDMASFYDDLSKAVESKGIKVIRKPVAEKASREIESPTYQGEVGSWLSDRENAQEMIDRLYYGPAAEGGKFAKTSRGFGFEDIPRVIGENEDVLSNAVTKILNDVPDEYYRVAGTYLALAESTRTDEPNPMTPQRLNRMNDLFRKVFYDTGMINSILRSKTTLVQLEDLIGTGRRSQFGGWVAGQYDLERDLISIDAAEGMRAILAIREIKNGERPSADNHFALSVLVHEAGHANRDPRLLEANARDYYDISGSYMEELLNEGATRANMMVLYDRLGVHDIMRPTLLLDWEHGGIAYRKPMIRLYEILSPGWTEMFFRGESGSSIMSRTASELERIRDNFTMNVLGNNRVMELRKFVDDINGDGNKFLQMLDRETQYNDMGMGRNSNARILDETMDEKADRLGIPDNVNWPDAKRMDALKRMESLASQGMPEAEAASIILRELGVIK